MVLPAAGAFALEAGGVQAAPIALVVGGVRLALDLPGGVHLGTIRRGADEMRRLGRNVAVVPNVGKLHHGAVEVCEVAEVGHCRFPFQVGTIALTGGYIEAGLDIVKGNIA